MPDNCHCIGRLDQEGLVRAYQFADALVFPSRLEGFGLVAAEAMACGLPVIVSNSSSLSEVVEHEVTGLLCPVDDVVSFVSAVRRMAKSGDVWLAMRHAARKRATMLFDQDQQVNRFLDVYSMILTKESQYK